VQAKNGNSLNSPMFDEWFTQEFDHAMPPQEMRNWTKVVPSVVIPMKMVTTYLNSLSGQKEASRRDEQAALYLINVQLSKEINRQCFESRMSELRRPHRSINS